MFTKAILIWAGVSLSPQEKDGRPSPGTAIGNLHLQNKLIPVHVNFPRHFSVCVCPSQYPRLLGL